MKKLLVAIIVAFLLFPVTASAKVLTFDDLPDPNPSGLPAGPIPVDYGGLTWSSHFWYTNSSALEDFLGLPQTGFSNGVVSPPHVAANDQGLQISVSNCTFDFNGAYLTAAINENLLITVEGLSNGVVKYSETVTVGPYEPTWFDFNFMDIDELVFSSFGGMPAFETGWTQEETTIFVIDDFTFNEEGTSACNADYNGDDVVNWRDRIVKLRDMFKEYRKWVKECWRPAWRSSR